MKKFGFILLGFIIGAVLTYYFCPRPTDEKIVSDEMRVTLKDTISVAAAKILSKNWEQRNPIEVDSLLEVDGSRKKTRSVWWSLEEVNAYLAYAQAEANTVGYDMTGVRVYLGNYGNDSNPNRKNRNTMFIVPTGTKTTAKASSLSLFLPPSDGDIPITVLNKGVGGGNGYPN